MAVRLGKNAPDFFGPRLVVVVLDQGAGVEEIVRQLIVSALRNDVVGKGAGNDGEGPANIVDGGLTGDLSGFCMRKGEDAEVQASVQVARHS